MSLVPLTHSSSTDSIESLDDVTRKKRPREGSDIEEGSSEVCPNDALTCDSLVSVFRFCSLKDLTNFAFVCRNWNRAASHASLWDISRLKELYPSIQVFSGERREDQRGFMLKVLIPTINQFAKLKILGDAGISVVTLAGVSLRKMAENGFGQIQRSIMTRIGDRQVTGTWVMTNSGLEGTGNLTLKEQSEAVKNQGFDMLELAPTFALCKKNETNSLGENYVRLDDSIQTQFGTQNLILGGSTEKGPNVSAYGNDVKVPHFYAGAMKRV